MTIIAQYGMVVMLQKVGGNFAVAFVLAGGIGVLLGLAYAAWNVGILHGNVSLLAAAP